MLRKLGPSIYCQSKQLALRPGQLISLRECSTGSLAILTIATHYTFLKGPSPEELRRNDAPKEVSKSQMGGIHLQLGHGSRESTIRTSRNPRRAYRIQDLYGLLGTWNCRFSRLPISRAKMYFQVADYPGLSVFLYIVYFRPSIGHQFPAVPIVDV